MPPQTPTSSPKRSRARVIRNTRLAAKLKSTSPSKNTSTSNERVPSANKDGVRLFSTLASEQNSVTNVRKSSVSPSRKEHEQKPSLVSNEDSPSPDNQVTEPDHRIVMGCRSAIVLVAVATYLCSDWLQGYVDAAWRYLYHVWWFRTVYFETFWVTLTYTYLMTIPLVMNNIRWFERFKVEKSTTYFHQPIVRLLKEGVVYITPLALLDTVIVKRYCGADPQEWDIKRQDWIQTTRALPLDPPSVFQMVYQVIGGVIIFDALFFVIHYALHKNRTLYTLFHQCHHDHSVMHVHITNQLTIGERIMLILSANQALKILSSHPLSRVVYTPVFVGLLLDNHCGYDVPWGLQHLLPKGMWGGPRLHFAHHLLGSRHYQPFLTYLDHALQKWEGRGKVSSLPKNKTETH